MFNIGDIFTNGFFGNGSPWQMVANPTAWWDYFKNGRTNEINQEVANQNLDFQKSEADYQHAWAENEREYQRALQERLFEREDTAYLRQAEQLSSMGINPLSQQLNGAGAGTPLSPSPSPTSSAPHNDFQMQDTGIFQALSPLLSLASTINQVQTGEQQRDSLALQNDAQFLKNLNDANKLGIEYKGYIPYQANGKNYRNQLFEFNSKEGTNLFDTSEFKSSLYSQYRQNKKDSMPSWQYTLDTFGNDDVYKQAEKALTRGANLFGNSFDNLMNNSLKDLSKDKNGKFNPFSLLLNLFF